MKTPSGDTVARNDALLHFKQPPTAGRDPASGFPHAHGLRTETVHEFVFRRSTDTSLTAAHQKQHIRRPAAGLATRCALGQVIRGPSMRSTPPRELHV